MLLDLLVVYVQVSVQQRHNLTDCGSLDWLGELEHAVRAPFSSLIVILVLLVLFFFLCLHFFALSIYMLRYLYSNQISYTAAGAFLELGNLTQLYAFSIISKAFALCADSY